MRVDKEEVSRFIPNTTQVPNIVLDWMMAELSGAEFKTLMFFIRQRYGFLRFTGDFRYSIQQIAEGIFREITNEETGDRELVQVCAGTGMSRDTVAGAVASLAGKRLIVHKSGKDRKVCNSYELLIDEHEEPMRKIRTVHGGKSEQVMRKIPIDDAGKPATLETKDKPRKETKKEKSASAPLCEAHDLVYEYRTEKKHLPFEPFFFSKLGRSGMAKIQEIHGIEAVKKALAFAQTSFWATKHVTIYNLPKIITDSQAPANGPKWAKPKSQHDQIRAMDTAREGDLF